MVVNKVSATLRVTKKNTVIENYVQPRAFCRVWLHGEVDPIDSILDGKDADVMVKFETTNEMFANLFEAGTEFDVVITPHQES